MKYLIDPQNIGIFLNPMITPEGDTLNYNKNIGKNYIKNNLVFQICEILKQKDKLEMNDFIQLKLLLKDKKTGKYFKNPIVISTGETIEGDYNIHKCYQNKVIFNLINDIGILLEESFFNFKEIKYDYIENNKEKYDNNELTIYTLNLEINNLTQKNKVYEKQILDFKNQEEKYKQDINNLKEKNSKLTLEINKLEEENKKLISEINKLKEENNKLNQNVKNNNVNNNEREVIVSFDNKNFPINFDKNISFQNFKNIIFQRLNIYKNEEIDIHYFNIFGKKIFIINESEFELSLKNKVYIYYVTKKISKLINNPYKISDPNNSNKHSKTPDKLLNNKEKSIINEQKKISEVIEHFASNAFLQKEIPKEVYINGAVYVSDLINKINIYEKKNYPDKTIEKKQILKSPGLLSDNFQKEDNIFILSLISQILGEKGINVNIYKDEKNTNKLDGASCQYLFGGLTEKKKFTLLMNLEEKDKKLFKEKNDELAKVIDDLKSKYSTKLNINKNDLYLVNPKYSNGKCSLDLVSENIKIESNINKLKEYKFVQNIIEKPLIEGYQLNSDIFEPFWNNQPGGWDIGSKRGGEDYLSPLEWYGYGLKVKGKYDNGNDKWLDYRGKNDGEFAVAYLGISNIYGNKKNMKLFFQEIISENVLKMGYEQTYKDDINLRNPSKKCGSGIYLFQNPKIAENTAGIINVGGVRYKVLLMCRVNPNRIRQPQGFKDCWILNPSPFEIRPYRILIKKIFISPLAVASQYNIKTFTSTPSHVLEIFKEKDNSFYHNNNTGYSDDDFVINLYTKEVGQKYKELNNYLKEGKLLPNPFYTEKEIKSWAWCLFNAINKKKSNVPNGAICYRGISKEFPQNLGVGSKFIFSEFVSTTIDKEVAKDFSGGKTLIEIRIENNNIPNYYCYYIVNISEFPDEKEILIVCNCIFQITNKEKKSGMTHVKMTCNGFISDK